MKNPYIIALITLACLTSCTPAQGPAYDLEAELTCINMMPQPLQVWPGYAPERIGPPEVRLSALGFEYVIEGESVRITRCFNHSSFIDVPEQIEGRPVSIIGGEAFYKLGGMASITLPESLTSIESGAFYRCYSLREVRIPSGVSRISGNPFYRCPLLARITVDPANAKYSDIDGVLFDKEHKSLIVYPEGRSEEEYHIPATVTRIDKDAFGYHCVSLRRLLIPSSVVELPMNGLFTVENYLDGISIIVEAGSVAEQYAIEYGYEYEVLE